MELYSSHLSFLQVVYGTKSYSIRTVLCFAYLISRSVLSQSLAVIL